ncbi:membrane protein [Aureimonas sp. SA4125]|uniref:DUF1206 domain-containing protein n=1 Tax=Aureimonas sp. SA4125 TaxID=2826993 RepID=UPI001CC79312|nr:DUF1206 domain-containing protein [Aureimonas sp. SA4125]BDA85523.1 membrane protein [Aureimonas sp. SA4125]
MMGEQVIDRASGFLEGAARIGYTARGLVYLVIGYFAFKAAYATGRTMDSKDAVRTVFGTTGGSILLLVLVAALVAFVVWRLLQAGFDLDHHGTGAKGLAVRAGLVGSAFSYGTLALFAALLLVGSRSEGGGFLDEALARTYAAGYGQIATYAIAALMTGVGAAHVAKGVTAGFEKYMQLPQDKRWMKTVFQAGLIARGLTFLLLAFLLVTGAASYAEGDKPGLATALDALAGWSYGWVYLAATGLGLAAFGLYALAQARYRRINTDLTG